MYFGSVKFFKHLIIAIAALMILVPVSASIILAIQNNEKAEEIERLKSGISSDNSSKELTADELMELYKNSSEKEAFLSALSEYDPSLYASFTEEKDEAENSIPALAVTKEPLVTTTLVEETASSAATSSSVFSTTQPPEAKPDYVSLYPELYVDKTDVVYNSDMDYIYLTFDDGPSQYTENILYYLDKYNLKATFFVVPSGSETSKELLKKIADAGHTIGVHSATHVYKDIYSSVEAYLSDFKIAYDRIYEATGIKCSLFRFPGGSINDFNEEYRDEIIAEMTRRGFSYFDWNVDSGDAAGATWTEMYTGVLNQVSDKNRAVILMHDHNNGYNTVLVLEDIIKALIDDERGFKFDKLTYNVKPVRF